MGQSHEPHEDVVAKIVETIRLDNTAEKTLHLALQELHVHQIELEQQNLALHEAQHALEESRDRYATLYDFAPVGYVSLSSRGEIQYINLTGAALLGQERGRLIGSPLANRLVSGGSRELFDFLRRASTSRGHATGEVQLTTADTNARRTVRLDGVTVTVQEGEQTCLTSLIDITDTKLMERDLRLSNAKLSSILTVAPIGIGLVRDRTFQWLNPRFLEMLGYAEHELIDQIHAAPHEGIDFIIFNPAGFTHTSIALRDALLGVGISFIEVHLSNVHAREDFRKQSYFSDIAVGVISGLGPIGYELALRAALSYLENGDN